ARVLGVQGLGHLVVACAYQRAALDKPSPDVGKLGQRAYLPGQVIQAEIRRARSRRARHGEQAEIVVVSRLRRPQERGSPGNLGPHLEPERVLVELHGRGKVADVKDGVIQTTYSHVRAPDRLWML